ncbi:hypothetical protein MW887_003847 [Aspergillus wentii]|nr:hypothetical protein MW887_003847 [Aspergillus wentii]
MGSHISPFAIIVGGGPSGLLLALLLGRRGISVQLLEAAAKLDDRPRATHYSAPAVAELGRAGLIQDLRAQGGFTPNGVCWRKLNGEIIAGLPGADPDEPNAMICLPLNQVNEVMLKHLPQYPSVSIHYDHKVIGVDQSDTVAWVTVETPEGIKTLEATYIIGCDGANSQIRRSLFGDREFPGFTWEEQLVATNTYYPFEEFGYDRDSNFIIDSTNWYMAARISNDGLYRITYGELPGLTLEELKKRQASKFREMLPGHPEPDSYQIVNFSPYKVHQRLSKKMRVGRVLLAADAAHLCNPFGGFGLTGGLVDVGGLFDCLAGIYDGVANDSILDKYDKVRRAIYEHVVNPVSCDNLRRMFQKDPTTALRDDGFLQMCKKAETDPSILKAFAEGANALCYDFTQHYHAKR